MSHGYYATRNKNPYNKTECEKCGYDDPRALHTHHVRDENRNVIGVAMRARTGLEFQIL